MDILQNNQSGAFVQSRLTIEYWFRKILLFYIFSMPFVSAFALTGTISFPLVLAVFLFCLMGLAMIESSSSPKGFVGYDLLLILLFLFWAVFSYLINGFGIAKSLNHAVAYLSTFLLFFVAVKYAMCYIKDPQWVFKNVLLVITITCFLSVTYANAEFISSNILGIDLNDYVHRPTAEDMSYRPTVVGMFFRARGFSAESGHFAFNIELFWPLAVYYLYFSGYCRWPAIIKGIFLLLTFSAFVFATSSASFLIIPVAGAIAVMLYITKVIRFIKKHLLGFFLGIGFIAGFITFLNYYLSFSTLLLLSLTDKAGSGSFDDRQDRIDFFYDKFFQFDLTTQLIGTGPAGFEVLGYDESKAILVLYYSIPFELGLVGLLLLSAFFLYILIQAARIRSAVGFFLVISVMSGIMHYYFIANFWYPWFWFIGAFVFFCKNRLAK